MACVDSEDSLTLSQKTADMSGEADGWKGLAKDSGRQKDRQRWERMGEKGVGKLS